MGSRAVLNDNVPQIFPRFSEFLLTVEDDFSDLDVDIETEFENEKKYTKTYIRNLQENMQERYPDLDLGLYEYVHCPFAIERSKFPRGFMALELADLREDMDAKYLYEKNDLIRFWLSMDEDKYSGLKGEARKVLVRMGTKYTCEAGFSHMTYIKSKHRSRITDEHLNNYFTVVHKCQRPENPQHKF